MKYTWKILLLLLMVTLSASSLAQTARELVNEGIQLNNAKNYTAAIDKFKAALVIEPGNTAAKYQMAFSLNAIGQGKEALPYLQEVINANPSAAVLQSAYSIMAGIYDRTGQAPEAISNYKLALKLDSADYSLHYGLGLAYFRNKQYSEAEQSAVNALKADATQPASLRLYGLVTFHQNERAPALLSLCQFLYLDPKGIHANEAYSNIQSILQGGILKAEPGVKRPQPNLESIALNEAITSAGATVEKRKYSNPTYIFTEQLQAIFALVGNVAQKQFGNRYFRTQLAARFYKLSQSGHMPAFVHYISQSQYKTATAWLALHKQQVEEMKKWMTENYR